MITSLNKEGWHLLSSFLELFCLLLFSVKAEKIYNIFIYNIYLYIYKYIDKCKATKNCNAAGLHVYFNTLKNGLKIEPSRCYEKALITPIMIDSLFYFQNGTQTR